MDALLQIIIPRINELSELKITTPTYEWGGVKYPQGPKVISWLDVTLSFDEETQFFKKLLPPS